MNRYKRLDRNGELARTGPLRKKSRKTAKAERALDKLKPALIERSGGYCEARFSRYCTGVGTAPHHKLKRSAAKHRHRLEELLWVCNFCNGDIENRPDAAHAAGLTIKSWERAA